MSVEAMAIALHHTRAKTATAKLVLLGIANHDGDGGAWPSLKTLARYAMVTDRRAVQRAIEDLIAKGEIRRHVQAGGRADMPEYSRPNLYEFTLSCPATCDRSKNHKMKNEVTLMPELGGAVVEPPRGPATAGGAVQQPPKPSLELLPTLNEKSSSPKRASASEDELDREAALLTEAWIARNRA